MSLKDRFMNIARAELLDATRKLKSATDDLLGERSSPYDPNRDPRLDLEPEPYGFEPNPPSMADDTPAHIRQYYANLELEVGADAAEVKAAYRRLMRQYHPDKHALDPKRAQLAHELTQRLRTAYDGLMEHLEERNP